MAYSPSRELPPALDYSLLFPDVIKFHMEKNPSFPLFAYANESSSDTLIEISYLEFGRAAHRVAHALRPTRQGPDGQVVMIIANTDTILHHAVLVGLFVAGWVPFPVSPRNSPAAVASMMKKTNCTRIVTLDLAHKALINGVLRENEGIHVTVYELPTLRYAFPRLGEEVAEDLFVPYPPQLERPDLDSPAIYVHSSGSSGFPKPIAHSHKIQIQWLAQPLVCMNAELRSPRRIAAMALPAFHGFGIVSALYTPIVSLVTTVVYPPRTENDPLAQPVIPTSDNIIDCLKKIECNVLFTVPAFLEQMAASKEAIEVLKKVDSVRFSGGPLPIKVGQALWEAGVKLACCYGGTEIGPLVAMPNPQDVADGDWMWLRFADNLKLRWAPAGEDAYELQILTTEDTQMAIENIPDVKGYATADVCVKHPTKDMWRIVGRADDVIILASGEKTVPAPMESVILSSPLVQGTVMFGRERNQVGVLVEPRPEHSIDVRDDKAVAEFRNRIWPVIEEANKPSPAFSRIFKEMVLITSGEKPMLRSAKGTIQRKATLDAYEAEIGALYYAVDASLTTPDGLVGPSTWTSEVLEGWLLELACSINSVDHVDSRHDLFAQGFDSLSVTFLRNRILGALRTSSDPAIKKAATRIPPNVIFENPTIQLLSSRIAALVADNGSGQAIDLIRKHEKEINAMIEKYSAGLDEPIEPAVILITGTTGGLGSFLLSELLKHPSVHRVFAYNRPSSTQSLEARQRSAFEDKGLPTNLLKSAKLVYVEADASVEKCGLSPTQYEEIRNSVTLIIHNAWRLDFNLAISSFEENIRASRNLIDLGLDSPQNKNLRFFFTSSIGTAQSWDNSNGPFPEDVLLGPMAAVGAGYGEAKYSVERIILKSRLHATSLRIGQIVGGLGGSWATSDWFPILVKSSVALGVFPDAAGVLSWLRQEDVARVILEIAFSKEAPPPVLNMVNPRGVPWAEIVSFVRRSIITQKGLGDDVLPTIPFVDWFALLESKAENASEDDLAQIPAIKLLEFFRALARGDGAIRKSGISVTEAAGMANFSTTKAQRVSSTMENMQAIGEIEADAWVGYWMSKGAF